MSPLLSKKTTNNVIPVSGAGGEESTGSSSAPTSIAPAATGMGAQERTVANVLMDFADKWAALIGFAAMIAFFWIDAPSTFGTFTNLKAVLDQAAIPILLGVGVTVVLALGEFDVSFPYTIGLSSAVGTLTMTSLHLGTFLAVVFGIGAAMLANAIAGIFVAQQRVSSFVITLGFGFVWLGIADGLTSSQTITSGLSNGFINLTSHRVAGFTLATVIALAFALLIYVLFRWTVLGRNIQSVGSNATASRLAGLPMTRIRIVAYVIGGIGIGLAGIIITSRQAQYVPDVGTDLFLTPFVAAFFGMSVLGIRRFNVLGTVVGALFIGTLQTGLVIIGAASWVGEFIQGAALLIILLIARRTR